MGLRLYVVDAFTEQPFSGNPAAVAIVESFPPELLMQEIAAEMNLSETAFVAPRPEGDFDLRWFTPRVEVSLCGHATLAAAHLIGQSSTFHTRSGRLTTRSNNGLIEMNFPTDIPSKAEIPEVLLGLDARWFGHGRFDALIELPDEGAVRNFRPDLEVLSTLASRAVIITSSTKRSGYDCVSRVFAPNVGVPEDPVTGSAHCTLAPFWSQRLGRIDLVGEQASPRGGTVHMQDHGNRVVLSGNAVTVAEVTLTI